MDNLVSCILSRENLKETFVKSLKQHPELLNKPYKCYTKWPSIYYGGSKKPALHYAVVHGHIELTKFLLECETDINATCKKGQTALHAAATCNMRFKGPRHRLNRIYSCLEILLNSKKMNINHFDKKGMTPLHLAVQHDDGLALMYIQAGADVQASHILHDLNSPIHEAAVSNNTNGIDLLLKQGANINARNLHGLNALGHMLTRCIIKHQYQFDERLKRNPVIANILQSIQHDKIVKTVKFLFENQSSYLLLDIEGFHALSLSVKLSSSCAKETTNALFSIFLNSRNANEKDDLGFCPIHYTVLARSASGLKPVCASGLKPLLDAGCDVNAKDSMGRTCLHLIPLRFGMRFSNIMYDQQKDSVQWLPLYHDLIRWGALVTLKDHFSRLPLHYAVEFGLTNFAEQLLLQSTDIVNATDNIGLTAAHIASSKNDVPMLSLLIHHGATIDVLDNAKSTPLHHACFAKATEVVELLVKHGADPFLANCNGETPIDIAKFRHSTKSLHIISTHLVDSGKPDSQRFVSDLSVNLISVDYVQPINVKIDDIASVVESISMTKDDTKQQEFEQFDSRSLSCNAEDKLTRLYKVPGIGLVSPDMPEVFEIAEAVTSLVEKILYNVAILDYRFKGTVIPSGSYFENTKIGDPDEFDFMVNLDYFMASKPKCIFSSRKLTLEIENRELSEFFHFDTEIGASCLSGNLIMVHFVRLLSKAIPLSLQNIHQNLVVMCFFKAVQHIISGQDTTTNRASSEIKCIWNGPVYKSLHISIDIVPCFYSSDWPENAKSSQLVDPDIMSLGYHRLPCASRLAPRISFSIAEKSILKSLPPHAVKAYVYAKILRSQCVCPQIHVAFPKTAKEIIDPANLIPSIILKTLLFKFTEENTNNFESMSSTIIAEKIYEKFEQFVKERQQITSYFSPDSEICWRNPGKDNQYLLVINCILKFLRRSTNYMQTNRQ